MDSDQPPRSRQSSLSPPVPPAGQAVEPPAPLMEEPDALFISPADVLEEYPVDDCKW
jgi:hypothetical protein